MRALADNLQRRPGRRTGPRPAATDCQNRRYSYSGQYSQPRKRVSNFVGKRASPGPLDRVISIIGGASPRRGLGVEKMRVRVLGLMASAPGPARSARPAGVARDRAATRRVRDRHAQKFGQRRAAAVLARGRFRRPNQYLLFPSAFAAHKFEERHARVSVGEEVHDFPWNGAHRSRRSSSVTRRRVMRRRDAPSAPRVGGGARSRESPAACRPVG